MTDIEKKQDDSPAVEGVVVDDMSEYLKYDGSEFTGWSIIKHSGVFSTVVAAFVGGAVVGGVAYALGSPWFISFAMVGAYLSMIGWIDSKTFIIKNAHTALFLPIFAVSFLINGMLIKFSDSWGVNGTSPELIEPFNYLRFVYGLGSGLLVAVVMFLLIIFANFRSGGDIKLSPLVAVALGLIGMAYTPVAGADGAVLALSWFLLSTVLTLVHMGIMRVVKRKKVPVPFGVSMVVALPLALLADYLFVSSVL